MSDPSVDWFAPATLEGAYVRLEPMAREHLPGLVAAGRDPRIWTWLPTDGSNPDGMRALVEDALAAAAARTQIPFVTIDRVSDRVVGSSRYLAPAPADLRIEIGWTWLDPAAQRSAINSEAKLLMLGRAFDALGCRRVELKTDARNEQSRAAILGIGATFEGIFRKHMVMPGDGVRHSAWYSVTDDDWPAVRERLEALIRR
jgi:RimJ/RimL family protein N-acetyltransferase